MSEKIYGRKPVLEAIRSGARAISRIYLMQGSRDDVLHQIEAHANARGIQVSFETRHRMDTMAGSGNHQGVVAVAEAYQYADLPDLLKAAKDRNEPPFLVLLDEIEDPQNLGAIIRSADAAGAHGVVIPKHHAVEVNATVVKASAGAAEHMATVKTTNLNEAIRKLKDEGVWVVGAAGEAAKPFYEYDFKRPVAIIIGNEGKGLRRLVRENCDDLVKIPMAGKMSSLNASVASALLMFEVVRQRNWQKASPAPPAPSFTPIQSFPPAMEPPRPPFLEPPAPERDFFRPGPDPAPEAPVEGPDKGIDLGPWQELEDLLGGGDAKPPGNDKGGGFKW